MISVMATPAPGDGFVYAAALGAMIGIPQVSHSAGLAEAFGTAHPGAIRGTTFVVGVSGAAAGPLPLLWSLDVAYWMFLVLAACGSVLGIGSLRQAWRAR